MYDRAIVDRSLRIEARRLNFDLVEHTIAQVEEWTEHLKKLVDPDTHKLKRALRPEEKKWIQNERAFAKCDYLYFASRYAFILNWSRQVVRYQPNVGQRMIIKARAKLQRLKRAIMMMVLKARQVGITTDTQVAIGHQVLFHANVNACVASSDDKKSEIMAKKFELLYDRLPWWLQPTMTKYNTGALIEFGGLNSAITIQHGSQTTGIARGDTPTAVHLSEVCDFGDPKGLIDASLLKAMHESPELFGVFEGTADGRHNWWHNTWLFNKENYWENRSRLCPTFLPWFIATDLYPTQVWIASRPIPGKWIPKDLTIAHAERARGYVQDNELLRDELGSSWQMSKEQMWFWEVNRAEHEAKDELAEFLSEMPADDIECFQSKATSVFSVDIISSYNEHCKRPIAVFGVEGPQDEIPLRMQAGARDIREDLAPIEIDKGKYRLLPLKWNGRSGDNWINKIFVYEWPEDEESYGLGIDTGDGIGKDRTVIEGLRKGTIARNDAQVLEYANPYVNANDLWPIVHVCGKLYTVWRNGKERQPRVCVECKGNGEAVQHELRKRGWWNFHPWLRYDTKKIQPARSSRWGWYTNSWSRPLMMDYTVKALRDGWVDINSPWFVDEMQDLERDESIQDARAAYNCFDDRYMALGIIWFSLHILELRGSGQRTDQRRAALKTREKEYPKYQPNSQALAPEATPQGTRELMAYARNFAQRYDTYEQEEYV